MGDAPWTYDRERDQQRTPFVRVAEDFDRWCVERLAGYRIVSRTHCPTRADAQAMAAEIARVEGIAILPDRLMLTAAEVGADGDGGDAA